MNNLTEEQKKREKERKDREWKEAGGWKGMISGFAIWGALMYLLLMMLAAFYGEFR